ncbi:dockerin type I repeat-containing protein [Porcipelethomonas sp.]|uniref:dockerin type I repeat-containing protein n=1 Tax=Porcipelethomonas sp. TaxID=2981675 RepID=UPI003EF81110
MKIKPILCSAAVMASFLMGSLGAKAEEITVSSKYEFHDNVCGKICVTPDSGSDTYIQIYKVTPESPDEGFLIYDSVIKADTVNEGDVYVFPLECNSFDDENVEYFSSYMVKIGIPKFKTSSNPIYYTQTVYVDDTEYFVNSVEYSDIYVYNLNLTDSILSSPAKELVSSDNVTLTYSLTFTSLDFIAGDANEDGVVNIRDASLIARKLAEQKVSELPPSADFNSDGIVNVRDAAAIASYIAKGYGN